MFLVSCGDIQTEGVYPNRNRGESTPYQTRSSIFGESGATLGGNDQQNGESGGGIGVNGFLWRATLDTVAFMPVNSADPFGGVIITDWYAMPEAPLERFKMNVYILGRSLRADGIRVAVFRQVQVEGGQWQDAMVPDSANVQIEDAILTRARQLRFDTLQQ
ncbi:MAG: DUF3576 domain-containing protein [Rhodospirillales bacterium]|nr:DUF3576 domain-containing protein [Rhodospirillales bacterium]